MLRGFSALLGASSLFVLATAAAAQTEPQPVEPSANDATAAEQTNTLADRANDDGAIIITARRRAENLLDVPQTVSAVTSRDLQQFNFTKFEDISQIVPGLNLSSDNSGFGARASTRGVTFDVSSQGSPTVETYFNEHPVEPNLMFQAQFDIGQIEVLKGPQGTLRGRSAPSGAMTLTTRRPDLNEIGGALSAQASHRGNMNFQGALGIPIIRDVLAIRVAGLLDYADQGGVKSAITRHDPEGRTWGVRGTIRFEPTESISTVVMYQHMDRRLRTFGSIQFGNGAPGLTGTCPGTGGTTGFPAVTAVGFLCPARAGATEDNLLVAGTQNCPPGSVVGQGTCGVLPGGIGRVYGPAGFNGPVLVDSDYTSVSDFPNLTHQVFDILTAQFDWRFGGQKLSYVGGYSYTLLDSTGGGGDASNTVVGRQAQPLNLGNVATDNRWTNELRLSSEERLFGMLDYTVGVYQSKRWGETSSPTQQLWAGAFGSPLGASAPTGPGLLQPTTFDSRYGLDTDRFSDRKDKEKAIFANFIAHLFDDRVELEAGARQFWFSAGKSQINRFRRGLMAVRNPNATALNPNAACPGTLSGTSSAGLPFINAQVVGSTYTGTCDVQLTVGNGFNQGQVFPFDTRSWSPFVYKGSISFKITPDHMIYANYGTAWRAGPGPISGIQPCAAINTPNHPDQGLCDRFNFLDPDKTKGGEIGFKGAFFDRKLNLTVAAYKQKFSGMFVFGTAFEVFGTCIYPHIVGVTVQPSTCSAAANQLAWFNAPVKVKGIDFEASFRLNEDLNIGGSASWADSKFAGGLIPCSDRTWDGVPDTAPPPGLTATQYFNSFPGAQVPASAYGYSLCDTATNPNLKPNQSPKWNFNLRGEYSHEVFAGGRAFIRALYNFTPKNKNLNPVTTYVPDAYSILNLFVGLRGTDGAWEVSLAARNLLNNKTRLTLAQTAGALTRPPSGAPGDTLSFGGAGNSSGYTTTSFVNRREFQLSARFAFGSR